LLDPVEADVLGGIQPDTEIRPIPGNPTGEAGLQNKGLVGRTPLLGDCLKALVEGAIQFLVFLGFGDQL
jgi:hypothetical protein